MRAIASSPSPTAHDREPPEALSPDARRSPAVWVALAGGAGLFPVAPGTAGSALGVALFVWIAASGAPPVAFAVVLALVLAAGFWASGPAGRLLGRTDDGRIVIDEVAGQLVTYLPLVAFGARPGFRGFWLAVVTGFVLFRGFDIAKPGPVRWAERRIAGGAGVMADDLVAGVLAAGCLAALGWLFEQAGVPA